MKEFLNAFFSGLSEKEKRLLYAAGVVICLALFDRLILGPIFGEMDKLDDKIQATSMQIKSDMKILQYKKNIVDKYVGYGLYFAPENLTEEERIAIFLNEVESSAKRSGIALNNINPVQVENMNSDMFYSLAIECTGTMKDLLDFIYGIESSKKMLAVDTFSLTPKNRDEYMAKASLTIVKKLVFPLSEDILA